MTKFYAGIGSRETPANILSLMTLIGAKLEKEGFVLRSGGANGADLAFEELVTAKEIYLPWKGFNGSKSSLFSEPTEKEIAIASAAHPNWNACSSGAKKMHCRNVRQVLGMDGATPSSFIICWTPNAKAGGGTGQAIRIAKAHNIPVFDLADPISLERVSSWVLA